MQLPAIENLRSRHPIGLDVGSTGIRLVQLKRSASGPEVAQSAVWDRSAAEVEPSSVVEIAERVERFLRQAEFAGRRTVACLAPPCLELHPLDLPLPPDRRVSEDLVKAANWEIQRLSALKGDKVQTGIWTLPASKRSRATMMGVAAPVERVHSQIALCKEAGLECVKVDAAPAALAALAWLLRGESVSDVWGLLDLGGTHARLVICADDVPVLVRTFDVGGRKWTEKIAEGLRLSVPAAEKHKREFGLSGPPGLDQDVNVQERCTEDMATLMEGILRDELQQLSLECERSYEYVLQCYPKRTPGDLVLTGGGALVNGLENYLGGKLGIPVLRISACPTTMAERIVTGLGSSDRLETCALACALSLAG